MGAWIERVWRDYVQACDRYHDEHTIRTEVPEAILHSWDNDDDDDEEDSDTD